MAGSYLPLNLLGSGMRSTKVAPTTRLGGATCRAPTGSLDLPGLPPAQCSKRITFQHTFPLPRKPQSTPRPPKRAGKKKKPKPASRADNTKKPAPPKDPIPKRIPLTPEAKKERQQAQRRKRYNDAKALGVCRHCSKPAIKGQTRCQQCAERHRVSRRTYDIKRHAEAKEVKKLKQAIALAEKIAAGAPTKCRECKNAPRPGQTRCHRCANRHNEYRKRSGPKRRPQRYKRYRRGPGLNPDPLSSRSVTTTAVRPLDHCAHIKEYRMRSDDTGG